jgi:hypothetical protein
LIADDGKTGGGDRTGGNGTGGWANTPSGSGGSGGSSRIRSGIGLVFHGASVTTEVQSALLYRHADSSIDTMTGAIRLEGGYGLQLSRTRLSDDLGIALDIGGAFVGGVMVVEANGLPPVMVPLTSTRFDLSLGLLDSLANAGVRELRFRFVAADGIRLSVMTLRMTEPAMSMIRAVKGRAMDQQQPANQRMLVVTSY